MFRVIRRTSLKKVQRSLRVNLMEARFLIYTLKEFKGVYFKKGGNFSIILGILFNFGVSSINFDFTHSLKLSGSKCVR